MKQTDCEEDEEVITRRKKRKGRKQQILQELDVQEIHHTLSDEEKICDCCGEQMKPMGVKVVREIVQFVPAHVYKEVHTQEAVCCDCHDENHEAKPIKSAVIPKAPIQGSFAGATVLAWLLHQKFELHLPLYRQVEEWHLYGLDISDRTLVNWVMTVAHDWLKPIYHLIYQHLMSLDVLHADETRYQIINRSDGKSGDSQSRIWEVCTTHGQQYPAIYYHSSLTRSGAVAKKLFSPFSGYLHTDGYGCYQHLEGIFQVGCWVHVLRKFKDVGVTFGKAGIAIKKINLIFKKDKLFGDLDPKVKKQKRLEAIKPLMDDFFEWLDTFDVLAKSSLAKAVGYAKNQKESLLRVLEDGRLQLSNNRCEQFIRTIAMGRKNHLFSTSEMGAHANVIVYSIIMTAKANGLNPYRYLTYLFTHLPNTDFYSNPNLLEAFLPWNQTLQSHCR